MKETTDYTIRLPVSYQREDVVLQTARLSAPKQDQKRGKLLSSGLLLNMIMILKEKYCLPYRVMAVMSQFSATTAAASAARSVLVGHHCNWEGLGLVKDYIFPVVNHASFIARLPKNGMKPAQK